VRTNFPQQIEESGVSDTVLTQKPAESDAQKEVRFPKRIKHRGRTYATIYKPKGYPLYRLAWTVAGKRVMKSFPRYGDARKHADELVKELATGSQVTALTPVQASDALAAIDRLQSFHQSTGRKVSLLSAVTEFVEAFGKLKGCTSRVI